MVWFGLVWSGSGLVLSGLVWTGLVWSCLVLCCLVWSCLVWSGLVWSGLALSATSSICRWSIPCSSSLVGFYDDLIKPKKLLNPVKESKSHQELHHELMHASKSVEIKPELQRVLESRRRDQLIKQRKQEEDAHRKLSPLEAELLRRHRKLEEVSQLQEEQQENLRAPEFIKVKENLRRTSFQNDQKED
uniref:Actin-associated protein FAM107A n=1 Tax=Takifugu rubripes TaxID=31033 RepID=A0A3B5KKK4_TAKRU